jgi:c-di-GMP-related signal transduction protein
MTHGLEDSTPATVHPILRGMNLLIARQPIFDATDHIAGYELIARTGDAEQEDAGALVNALLGDGSRRLAEGNLAFVTVTRDMLLSGGLEALDPTAAVLQIQPELYGLPEVLNACRELADAGYAIALDDFRFSEDLRPLLELATIVKIDSAERGLAALGRECEAVAPYQVQLLAEGIDHRADHETCLRLGFSLFQGLLFARPEQVTRRDLSVAQIRTISVMNRVRDLDVTEQQLEEEFRTDPGLSYKLLRMVNSAASGGRGVRSILHALRLLGRDSLYRWLSLLLLSPGQHGGVSGEIVVATLTRARFNELLAEHGNRPLAAGSLFMTGLLSALADFGGLPVEQIHADLELAPEIATALERRGGLYGSALRLVQAYEDGDWDALDEACSSLGIDPAITGDLYLDALSWAQERARGLAVEEETDAVAVG